MGYATKAVSNAFSTVGNAAETIGGGLIPGILGSSKEGQAPDNSAEDEANSLANQQLQANQAELAQKEAALYRQRIGIIRANGAPDFTGNNQNAPTIGKPALGTPPMAPNAK